jgi:broad specificity phosphatase PhoE
VTLYLVRHAESVGNATGDYARPDYDSLSERGRVQALALAERLQAIRPAVIVTSPLRRALETIAPYLAAEKRRAEIWPELAEACWQWDAVGDPPSDAAPEPGWTAVPVRLDADLSGLFDFRDGRAVRPADDEGFTRGLWRAHETRDRFLRLGANGDAVALAVTHGNFLRELLNLFLGCRPPARFPHDNTGLTRLEIGNRLRVRYVNRV